MTIDGLHKLIDRATDLDHELRYLDKYIKQAEHINNVSFEYAISDEIAYSVTVGETTRPLYRVNSLPALESIKATYVRELKAIKSETESKLNRICGIIEEAEQALGEITELEEPA